MEEREGKRRREASCEGNREKRRDKKFNLFLSSFNLNTISVSKLSKVEKRNFQVTSFMNVPHCRFEISQNFK